MNAAMIDKVSFKNGTVHAYSLGNRILISTDRLKAILKTALDQTPKKRWISLSIGRETHTISNPTAVWLHNQMKALK